MEEQVVRTFLLYLNEDFKTTNVEDIVKNINTLIISNIYLDRPSYLRIDDNRVIKQLKTDIQNPLVFEKNSIDDFYVLYINPDWYLQNQHLVDTLICFISENINQKKLEINNSCLISSKVIDSLCKNKNLESVNLSRYEENGYILKYEDYLKFKSSTITKVESFSVDEKLKDVYEPIISYNCDRKLISHYNYKDLSNFRGYGLVLKDNLTEEELDNLKYIHSDTKIRIQGNLCFNFEKIYKKLKELNKQNIVQLEIEDKQKFNEFIFSNSIVYDDIYIHWDSTEVPLLDYIKSEKLLYQIVEPAKDLSPFEKYIYVYNITKQFKQYKENEQSREEARDLYSILNNEYMVCVGYSNMFGDLLDKLGIENDYLHVGVDLTFDNIEEENLKSEEIKLKKGNHARRYVHIVDEKYGINGFYVSDPTWDNDLENDYYNHLVMTDQEATTAKRYLMLGDDIDELFNVNSIQEFYQKINFILDRSPRKKLGSLITDVINKIKKIDKNYIKNLTQKYNFIDEFYFDWPQDLAPLIYDLGEFIVSRVNKTISGDTIMSAVEVVYRKSYGYSEEVLEQKLDEVREKNRIRQENKFPKRKVIHSDGSEEFLVDFENKFEVTSENKTI